MTQNEWILSDDKSAASRTMWAAINDVDISNYRKGELCNGKILFDIPVTIKSFGSCYRYYKSCNLSLDDLQKVKKVKWFSPFIDNWNKLVTWYEKHPKTVPEIVQWEEDFYDFIWELEGQSYLLDGWRQTSFGWSKDDKEFALKNMRHFD